MYLCLFGGGECIEWVLNCYGCLRLVVQESYVAFSHVLDAIGMLNQKQLATMMFKGVLENES